MGIHSHADCSEDRLEQTNQVPERITVKGSKVQRQTDRESRKSARVERNTLDAVKRNLLRRSDWMGLNAARPLHMDFPSAQEMENIGRRRKITAKEKERLEEVHRRPSRFNTRESMFDYRQPPPGIDEIPSIRVGSNIHQSQTTLRPGGVHNPRSVVCQSESSESMLLDKEVSSYQQYVGVQGSPAHGMATSIGPADELAREGIGKPLVSLDQVRDSETFDQVKARSDSLVELSSGIQQQKLSKATKRRAANRGLALEQVNSSSIITGRRLLRSSPPCSPGSGFQADSQPNRVPCFPRQKCPKPAPDSLSSGFLPPRRRSGFSQEETAEILSDGIREAPSNFYGDMDASLANDFVPGRGERQPDTRPKFTLEHQIEAEAEASGADGASNAQYRQTNDPPGQSRQDHSQEISDKHLARNEIDLVSMRAPALRQRRGSRITESSLASTTPTAHSTPAKNGGDGRRFDADQLLHNSGRTRPSISGDSSMGGLLDVSKVPTAARELGPTGQPSRGTPMRQRLGLFQQPASHASDKANMSRPQKDENQAWMRFVLQDEPGIASNHLEMSYAGKRESQRVALRCLQHHTDDDETLSEDYELRPVQTQKRTDFSPVETVRTMANTTIYEADAQADACAPATSQPSETDFLSQLSPMEGRLDERLLNPSLYTNPARTERGYLAAPSRTMRRGKNGIGSDVPESGLPDPDNSSPIGWIDDHSDCQTSSVHSSPALYFHSRTSPTRPVLHRVPSRAKPASFSETRRSPLKILGEAFRGFNDFCQSHSMVAQASALENHRGNWTDTDRSPAAGRMSLSARHKASVFPMNYTPVTHAVTKPRQDQSAGLRPSSSYSAVLEATHDRNGLTGHQAYPILHRTMQFHPPASLHSPVQQANIYNHAGDLTPFHSARPATHQSHQHNVSTTVPATQPRPCLFSTSSTLPTLPSNPISVQQSQPQSTHRSSHRPPEPPFSVRGPTRHLLSPTQAQAPAAPFSTPRPLRSSRLSSPGREQVQVQPFNTPRPVKPVLGRFRPPERRVAVAGWVGV